MTYISACKVKAGDRVRWANSETHRASSAWIPSQTDKYNGTIGFEDGRYGEYHMNDLVEVWDSYR